MWCNNSGVASVAIRALAHAAEVLTDRREQEEVLQIFDKINKETGWRIGFVYKELKERWGWNEEPSPQQFAQTHTAAKQAAERERQMQEQQQAQAAQQNMQQLQQGFDFSQGQVPQQVQRHNSMQQIPPPQQMQPIQQAQQAPQQQQPTPQKPQRPPAGIPNPMYAKADFSLPSHPYQNHYVPAATAGYNVNPQGGWDVLSILSCSGEGSWWTSV